MSDFNVPRVLVLLCTSNSMRFLGIQLDSIFSQVKVDIRVLCSDDDSMDGTYEYLSNIQSADNRFILLPRLKKFGSAGKNFYNLVLNADYNNYDFICFADHDDIWLDNKIISAINVIKTGNYLAYSSSFDAFWGNGKKKYYSKVGSNAAFDYLFASPGPGCTFVMSATSMANFAEYFKKHPIGQDVFHHDWLVYAWYKCNYPNSWYIDKNSYINYRQHYGNETGVNSGFKAIMKRMILIKNGWYGSEIEKILKFLHDSNNYSRISSFFNRSKIYVLFHVASLRRDFSGQFTVFLLILFNIISLKNIKRNI